MKRLLTVGWLIGVVLLTGCVSNYKSVNEVILPKTNIRPTSSEAVILGKPNVNCYTNTSTPLSQSASAPTGWNIVRVTGWWWCYDVNEKDTDAQIVFQFPHNNQSKSFIIGNELWRVRFLANLPKVGWNGKLATAVFLDSKYQYVYIVVGARICLAFLLWCDKDMGKIVRNFWLAYK